MVFWGVKMMSPDQFFEPDPIFRAPTPKYIQNPSEINKKLLKKMWSKFDQNFAKNYESLGIHSTSATDAIIP